MNYQAFVSGQKTLLIAPAGYGKTFTIAECLKHTTGKQLILTHTHAGVASIREKIQSSGIEPSSYCIETISSFAQRFVHAFYANPDIPDQEEKEYHPFVIKKAIDVFKSSVVRRVVSASYKGLFVDEYQDCNKDQHAMILALAEILPTHILGDPLQGIFDFNGEAIAFETDLGAFEEFPELPTPYRWYQDGNNRNLGNKLVAIRELLKARQPVVLTADNDSGFHVVVVQPEDLLQAESRYRKLLQRIITNNGNRAEYNSLLLIVPEYEEVKPNGDRVPKGDIRHRAQLRTQIDFSRSVRLLEAIDDKSFYAIAKKADGIISNITRARKKIKRLKEEILESVFNKTELDDWFNEDSLKVKRDENDKAKAEIISKNIQAFFDAPSTKNLFEIIHFFKNNLRLKFKREELLYSLLTSLKEAHRVNSTVYEAMKKNRNIIRRTGRKVHGKCIGTTLLTKGLEFDTVVILDAHKFNCAKHLYVALTRCCKRLIIFTAETTLSPYGTSVTNVERAALTSFNLMPSPKHEIDV